MREQGAMRLGASSACARKVLCPSSPPLRREQAAEASVKRKFGKKSPPRGSREEADDFCRRKFCELNFVREQGAMRLGASFACARKVLRPSSPPLRGRASPQGEAAKRLTIFAEENFVS